MCVIGSCGAAPFKGTQQTQVVHVKNDTEALMAFKVKTTAPKLYCVRPNSGLLQPGDSAAVTIIFQGLGEEPALGYKCKDKFLFVSIPCLSPVNAKDVSTSWAQLEQLAGGKTSDVKLKVLFNYDNPMNTIQEEDKSNASAHSATIAQPILPLQSIPDGGEAVSRRPIQADREALAAAAAAGAGIGAGAAGTTTGASSNITASAPRGAASSATVDSKTGAEAPPAVEKPFARVAPPTAATKSSSSETNVYLVAVLLIILAFLFSRFF